MSIVNFAKRQRYDKIGRYASMPSVADIFRGGRFFRACVSLFFLRKVSILPFARIAVPKLLIFGKSVLSSSCNDSSKEENDKRERW